MKKLNCILLVDDNVNDNFVHIVTIKEADAAEQIKMARDGRKALEYLEKAKMGREQYPFPELIFLDINMPVLDGFEFLENIKANNLISNGLPVIVVMTNSLNPNDDKIAKEKFSNEISAFANKPLTTDMLKNIIEKLFPED